MKRSDAVQLIWEEMDEFYSEFMASTALADRILTKLQKAGMIPPGHNVVRTDEELEKGWIARNSFEGPEQFVKNMKMNFGNQPVVVNEWEPEDV